MTRDAVEAWSFAYLSYEIDCNNSDLLGDFLNDNIADVLLCMVCNVLVFEIHHPSLV